MDESDRSPNPEVPRPWQPRFSIFTLLMLMLVCSVMAAAGSYLVRSLNQVGRSAHLVFILFTLSAPMLLMVAVSILRQVLRWLNRDRSDGS
jgi:hypothetical protein